MSRLTATAVALLVAASAVARAQGRAPRGVLQEDSTRITMALEVGGQRFDAAKQGRCVHAPVASIYTVVAAMWSLNVEPSPGSSVSLTVWRPLRGDSTPQLNFNVSSRGKSRRIATVQATAMQGKGTVHVTKKGPGGRFEIDGTTNDGKSVRGFIECAKFAAAVAVGGH
jgi:hypothetical protein